MDDHNLVARCAHKAFGPTSMCPPFYYVSLGLAPQSKSISIPGGSPMKLRIVCLVIVFFSVVLSMHATSCNQDTVNGTYAKSAIGQLGKGYGAVVFLATNNAGSFSGVGAENFNGTPIHFSGNIFGNGDEMVGISTDAGSAYQLTSYRLKKTQCTEASAKGSF